MKRYFVALLLILMIFGGLVLYRFKSKPKPKPIPIKSACEQVLETRNERVNGNQKVGSSIHDKIKGVECINGNPAAANEVMVEFDKSFTGEQVANLLKKFDIEKSSNLGDNLYLITSKQTSTAGLIEQFSALKEVMSVSPNWISHID